MRRLSLISVVVLGITATAASAAATRPFSADRTTTCLASHRVLANPAAANQTVPPGIPATSVISFSFALISAQALDNGKIVFERDAATAKRAEAAWVSYSVKQAAGVVQGLNKKQLNAIAREAFSLRGNAIIAWENPNMKPASKRRVAGCLR